MTPAKAFFNSHPVFRVEQLKYYLKKQGKISDSAVYKVLKYNLGIGKLIRIRRHLYAVIPETEPSAVIDPFLIAAYASQDAVIAYHSALELFGLAYSTFNEHTYLVSTPSRGFSFQGQMYHPTCYPSTLAKNKNSDYEIESVQRQGLSIRTTSLERTIVDVLDRPDLSGGWEEIIRSLERVVRFDPQKIVNYVLLLNKASTIAKVGVFLEQLPQHLQIQPIYLEQLLPYIPKQPYYAEPGPKGKGVGIYFKKWQLIMPSYAINKKWEEPDDSTL